MAAKPWKMTQKVEELDILIPGGFRVENFRSAVNYKPRSDDVFIVTYPKCGTTWTQQILLLIFKQGEPVDFLGNLMKFSPFLDNQGAPAAEAMQRPGPIKFHLPYRLCPRSEEVKYVYVTRNPKDCCVSYYHHEKAHSYDETFEEYFELFISGNVPFGDYFDHLLGWYAHRNDPNVLFVTFEEMKENPESAILKMASFLDDQKYAEPLRKDRLKLENIVRYSSFESMKESSRKNLEDLDSKRETDSKSPEARNVEKKRPPHISRNIRKGIVGDWKNYFSESQSRRLDEKFEERTRGTDIPTFWKKYMS